MPTKNEKIITTTGKLREVLADCLIRVSEGTLSANDAKAIIGLSNQITTNMAVELKHQSTQSTIGHQVSLFGSVNVGV